MRNAADAFYLFLDRVRRMVRGDVVDVASAQRLDHRQPVCRAAQRRIHLQPQPVVVREHRVIEEQMVRRDFARDPHAALPSRRRSFCRPSRVE